MTKRKAEFQDLKHFGRLTSADYNEKRNLLVYCGPDGVTLKDIASGTEKKITAGGGGEGSARFSPDGDRMLFVSSVQGKGRQAWAYDLVSGEVRQITKAGAPVMDPIWSPDGKKILFQSPVSAGTAVDYSADKVNELDDAIVIEDLGYKFDGAGYITPDDHMHLFVADAESGEMTRLTTGVCDFLHHSWSVDSKFVVCITDGMRPRSESLGYDLVKINIETKEITMLSSGQWMVSYPNPIRPKVTPDGKYAVMGVLDPRQNYDDSDTYPEVYLFKFAMDGSGGEQIFRPSATCYQCVQFPYNAGCGAGMDKMQLSEDGQYAYFVSGWQGQGVLYRVPVSGGEAERVLGGKMIYNGLGTIQNGKMLLSRADFEHPEGYYLLDTKTGELSDCLMQSWQKWLDEIEVSHAEDFFYDTKDGKARVQAFVVPPLGAEKGKKYPVIVYIHGGPHPFYTYGFGMTLEDQCFAAQGYGVLHCNPRGSSGYGMAHQELEQAYDGTAYQDILQLVDEAIARYDWVDPERIGVTGGSYGGYMTNYIATHSDRFKAYVTQRCTSNEMITYASSHITTSSKKYDSFEKFMLDEIDSPFSTITYVERIHRPFLILHGGADLNTPLEGAHQLFVALKDIHPDLPVKMVVYPHVCHEQPEEPSQQLHYYNEMLTWFRTYL